MKKLILAFSIFAIATSVNAQTKPTRFSIGVEAALPMGDFNTAGYKFGIGGSAQIEHKVASDLGLTLNAGYITFSNTVSGDKYHFSEIPVLAGVKYWFSPKVYAHGQLGAIFNSTKFPSSLGGGTYSSTGFGYSPGVGFLISNNVDLLIKYVGNSVSNKNSGYSGGTASTLGARLAISL